MANTKITTNVIADDAVTSDKLGGDLTMPGHVSLADNKELRIGTGNDLVIKHDGSHTTLTNTTGNFTFIGDQIYFANAANNEYLAQFIADGACSLRFNNTEELATVSGGVYIPNKLGIGDTTPQALLDVGGGYGANTTVATFAHATDAYIEIENITTQNGAGIILTNAGTKKWTIQKDTSAHSLHIQDTSGDVMTFLQGGNVGIGTTSPSSPLHVYEETANTNTYSNVMRLESRSSGTTVAGFGGAIYFLGERNGDGALQGMGRIISLAEVNSGTTLSSGMAFHTATAGTPSEKLRITHEGNVGIGTDSPSTTYNKQLHINASGTGASLKLTDNGSGTGASDGAEVIMYNTNMYVTNRESANMFLQTSANTQITIDSGGNVALANGNLSFLSGKGIDFANTSTQTGNTSVSHLFNDYEHGDFTPSLSHSNTCAVRTGRYVRVGDLVHFVIQVGNSMSDITSGNQFTVEGLPFPVYAANAAGSCFARYIDEPDNVVVYVTTNEALHLYSSGSGSWGSLYYSNLNSVSAYFYIHGSYRTT